jgi:hypothetical protein
MRIVIYKHPLQLKISINKFGRGIAVFFFGLSLYIYMYGNTERDKVLWYTMLTW